MKRHSRWPCRRVACRCDGPSPGARWPTIRPRPSSKPAGGQQQPAKLERKVTVTVKADYLLYLPPDYGKDQAKKWPVILFLHGSGERGTDLNLVKLHGPPKVVEQGMDLPFIVVSPQCPADKWWEPATVVGAARRGDREVHASTPTASTSPA